MKKTTEQIKSILDETDIDEKLNAFSQTYADKELHSETTGADAFKGYMIHKATLLSCIDNGYIDSLTHKTRNQIFSTLNALKAHLNQQVPTVIQQYISFADAVMAANCYQHSLEDLELSEVKRELLDLRRRYRKLVQDISSAESDKETIEEIKSTVLNAQTEIESVRAFSDNKHSEFLIIEEKIQRQYARIEEFEQDVENRKKEIVAFAESIAKNDELMDSIINNKSKIIDEDLNDKQIKIQNLIDSAEKALELKSAEGISAAYSTGFNELSKATVNYGWILGAVVSLVISLGFGYLLAGGEIGVFKYQNSDSLVGLVGRFSLVAVSISAAVFCANRHVRWKNLEEDYRYKTILSRSIVAFSNKIKEVDEDKVAEYLNMVLSELHQDPLRSRRNSKNDKGFNLDEANKYVEFAERVKKNLMGN